MNLTTTREQEDIRKAAAEFAVGKFDKEAAAELEEGGKFPIKTFRNAGQLGFIGIDFPEEADGQGMGAIEKVIVLETFSRADSTMGCSLGLSDLGSEIIMRCVSKEHSNSILQKIAAGKAACTVHCIENGNSGPHPATALNPKKDGFISGKLDMVFNGESADFIVLVDTAAILERNKPEEVILVLEPRKENISAVRKETLGLKMTPLTEIRLSDAPVIAKASISYQNEKSWLNGLLHEMIQIRIAALGVGIAQGALDRALNYAKKREAFGKPIGAFQVIQHYLANMHTEIELARLMTYKAASLYQEGTPCAKESCMAKRAAVFAAKYATSRAMQIHAGYGYMNEYDVQRYWRDAETIDSVPINNEAAENLLVKTITQQYLEN